MNAITRQEMSEAEAEVARALAFQAAHRAVLHEFQELLVYEAWLLDNDKYELWLTMLDDELRYMAPVRSKVAVELLDLASIENTPSRVCHFNDGKMELGLRVARFRTNFDHYNRPSALARRIVGNIRLIDVQEDGARVTVTSNFSSFRAREEREETFFVGARDDIWRRTDAGWRLLRRMIKLDHHIVPPISLLF